LRQIGAFAGTRTVEKTSGSDGISRAERHPGSVEVRGFVGVMDCGYACEMKAELVVF
jgi:hypothetical protein